MTERQDTVSPSPTRRGFLKTVAAGGAACATTSTISAPAAADGYDWKETIEDATLYSLGGPTALGVDYMMGNNYVDEATTRIANYAHRRFGDMRDYSGYTGADALHTEIITGTTQMRLADEKVLTSLVNNIEASDNVAYSKGQLAVADALNAGKSETEAQNQMETTLDDYFSKVQKNILAHVDTQMGQLYHMIQQVDSHSNLSVETVFEGYQLDGNSTPFTWETLTYSFNLLNGNTYDVTVPKVTNGSGDEMNFIWGWLDSSSGTSVDDNVTHKPTLANSPASPTYTSNGFWVRARDTDGSSLNLQWNEAYKDPDGDGEYNAVQVFEAWDQLVQTRDNVFSDLTGYVSDVYAEYEPGEVDLTDVVDPTTFATEMAQENNDEAFRQAAAAEGGFPTAATENVVITITSTDADGNEVSDQIRTDLYTQHVPTDGSGNEVGFQVGETYDPSTWSEPLFITYRSQQDGHQKMGQLEDTFTINKAYDPDGTEVDTFSVEDTTTHTSDVQELQNQLDQLRQEQLRLQEQAENTAPSTDDGAGGGTGSGGIIGWMNNNLGIGPIPGAAVGIGSISAAAYGVYSSTVSAASNAGPNINVGRNGRDK
ncbi:twin-arginine translocation signal domain-containing protein [Natronomonas amylolytica]|uniref:twin-arginine translocation signal domain-containing protein n=1 Tax=Natronomonas amylolytica TaxID=3108498 RepID=UPI003009F336